MGSDTHDNQAVGHGDVDVEKAAATTSVKEEKAPDMPDWRKVFMIMLAVYLCMFLVALVCDPGLSTRAQN